MTLLPEVESALLDAVRRDQRTRARGGVVRAWLRRRPRGLLMAAGALVVAGSAAAAVASFSTERSAPLAGVIAPYKAGGSTLSYGGLRYYLQGITPSLRPGEIGWCETYWVLGTVKLGGGKTLPHFGQGSGSCGGTAAVGSPIFAADGGGGPGLHFFFTAPDVTAVTLANRLRVLTRPDPGLPYGFRAAVFNLPSGTNIESVPIRPGGGQRSGYQRALDSRWGEQHHSDDADGLLDLPTARKNGEMFDPREAGVGAQGARGYGREIDHRRSRNHWPRVPVMRGGRV
jgi:hypothetical protein